MHWSCTGPELGRPWGDPSPSLQVPLWQSVQSNLSLRPPGKSDHLKTADTLFQSLQFADSIVRSAFLKMRPPEKCELRTPEVGPKWWFNLEKRPHSSKWAKNTFSIVQLFLQRHSERAIITFATCKFRLAWSLAITPMRTRGNYRSLTSMARAWAYEQLHFENSWTKPGKWDHLRNRTTYSQSLRWS